MSTKTEKLVKSTALDGRFVFLSASIPEGHLARDSVASSAEGDPMEISTAVAAAAASVFSMSGRLVFGGHPTISPLVLSVARDFKDSLDARPMVIVYQSGIFKGRITPETKELARGSLGEIRFTEAAQGDTPENPARSLALMREQMLRNADPVAAIFIGGMEGIRDEFNLFVELCPGRPVYPVGSAGGVARELASKLTQSPGYAKWSYRHVDPQRLLTDGAYPALMADVLADVTRG